MKLVSFSVENYRSITQAYKISLGQTTVLIGPNNEGKSNILRALVTAMNILVRARLVQLRTLTKSFDKFFMRPGEYIWKRDFPIRLQKKFPQGSSVLDLEFEFTPEELQQFRTEINSNLSGTLPLRISVGEGSSTVRVYKRGPGATALSKKSGNIASFVAKRIQLEHIKAVRTASSAEEIVTEMVGRELEQLENNPEYVEALKKIEDIQRPLLDSLSQSIKDTLVLFLPVVKDVKISIDEKNRSYGLRACDIVIDDGTPTLLKHKGDGVQSLVALGIIRHSSEKSAAGKNLVIAIEEPESHLHPGSMHELKHAIEDLAQRHQVVITTHSPLFASRGSSANNVIVNRNRAYAARNIAEVRKILGVRASDNLRNAELVLVVEGEDDRQALTAVLAHRSAVLNKALTDGVLGLDSLLGASNLAYKLTQLRAELNQYQCFLDYDRAALDAIAKARREGLIEPTEVHVASVEGLTESELEDLYDVPVYAQKIFEQFGVSLDSPKFKGNRKWSDRVGNTFKNQGKPWDNAMIAGVKRLVSSTVVNSPATAINSHKSGALDSLVTCLENRLSHR
jgi:energy-coupling factor transporter ATP-binding protein EcfA2